MARRRHTPEQIIRKLREAEVELAKGQTTADVARNELFNETNREEVLDAVVAFPRPGAARRRAPLVEERGRGLPRPHGA